MKKSGKPRPWRQTIAFFLVGQAFSLIGSSMVAYAIMWHVTLKTGSGTMMTAFTFAIMLPSLFIAPLGGVWADNFNRRTLINIADGFIAAVTIFIAISYSMGFENIWLLLACSAARSLGQGVQMPAVNALIPQIVPSESLLRINGINTMIQSISMLGTPALAGAILTFFPIQNILYIDVVTAAASITILFLFVKVARPRESDEGEAAGRKPMLSDLKDGLRYVRGHVFLRHFFILMSVFQICLAPVALLAPLQVARNFGEEVWLLTVMEIAFSAGMAAGGLVISTWGGLKNRTRTVAASFVFIAVFGVGLGLTKSFVCYSIFMAIIGVTAATGNTPALTVLQEKVDPTYMGRVFSVMTIISSVVMPFATAVFGPLSDRISLDIIIIATSALIGLIGIYIFTDKVMIEAGKREGDRNTLPI